MGSIREGDLYWLVGCYIHGDVKSVHARPCVQRVGIGFCAASASRQRRTYGFVCVVVRLHVRLRVHQPLTWPWVMHTYVTSASGLHARLLRAWGRGGALPGTED